MINLLQKNKEFLMYALFGIGTVTADVGLYTLFVDHVGILWANAIGWSGAVLFAFLTNKYFVFRTGGQGGIRFLREMVLFIAVRLVSLFIEVHGVKFLVEQGINQRILGVTGGLAKVIVTILVIIINYVFSKFFIFRTKRAHA